MQLMKLDEYRTVKRDERGWHMIACEGLCAATATIEGHDVSEDVKERREKKTFVFMA